MVIEAELQDVVENWNEQMSLKYYKHFDDAIMMK